MSTKSRLEQLWATNEIRYMLLYSLGVQALLTFLAPLRKRSSSRFLSIVVWILYLSADALPFATISLMGVRGDHGTANANMIAFWAPFLLVHLGGPDTITAVQYVDNELWDRHGLRLATKVGVIVAIIGRSCRKKIDILLFPTVLVFLYGFIKCIERILALRSATVKILRETNQKKQKPEPGLDYPCMMVEYSSGVNASLPTEIRGEEAPLVEPGRSGSNSGQDTHDMINIAYAFYEKFKGIVADLSLSSKDIDASREFYLSKQPLEACRLLRIELNFMYDFFYTKASLLQTRWVAYARVIGFFTIFISLLIFFAIDKKKYPPLDVGITYILLVGAVALDVSSMIMFLMSDWLVVAAYSKEIPKFLSPLMFLLLKRSKRARDLSRRTWTESISQYNLLKTLRRDPDLSLRNIFLGLFVNYRLDNQLLEFIVLDLQKKAQLASGDASLIREICSARGNLVYQEKYSLVAEYLRPWTVDVDYDESLITWHFATDLCYRTCTNKEDNYVQFSKTLSDYMSYIMFRQQNLIPTLNVGSTIMFHDTIVDLMKLISKQSKSSRRRRNKRILLDDQFCAMIPEEVTSNGDESRSVLYNSCCLAKNLKMFGQYQWEITSKIWLELLFYAASKSSPRNHIILLSKGGELITLVWLLMVHLGLGGGMNTCKGFIWTKLIIPSI